MRWATGQPWLHKVLEVAQTNTSCSVPVAAEA